MLRWPPLMIVTREAPGTQKVQNLETLSFGFSEFGYWGLKEKEEEVKAAPNQSVGPTKSKIFELSKVENKCQT